MALNETMYYHGPSRDFQISSSTWNLTHSVIYFIISTTKMSKDICNVFNIKVEYYSRKGFT